MVSKLDSVWDISEASTNNWFNIDQSASLMMDYDAQMMFVLGVLEDAGLIAVTFVPKRKLDAAGHLKFIPGCLANFRWEVTKKGKAYQKEHGVDLSAEAPGFDARNFEQMKNCAYELHLSKNK